MASNASLGNKCTLFVCPSSSFQLSHHSARLPFLPSAHTRPLPLHHSRRSRSMRHSRVCKTISQSLRYTEASEAIDDSAKHAELADSARSRRRQGERRAYLFAAVASSSGISFLAAGSVYYRFSWHMQVGMEFWARWAHRALWHASLWNMHESHHRPREGPFELNDVFAIINAAPAISLMAYGFLNTGLIAGLCFGAGLGITIFGIAYMFVHDGLVHKRFPVGPIADIPYFQKVAVAHKLHHADLFDGVPYGLFLGPKELQKVGGLEELEKVLKARSKSDPSSRSK